MYHFETKCKGCEQEHNIINSYVHGEDIIGVAVCK